MRLYASDLCACRGDPPTTGTIRLGLQQCAHCGMLRAGPDDVVVRPPARSWRDDLADGEREVTPLHRRARPHERLNVSVRDCLAGED